MASKAGAAMAALRVSLLMAGLSMATASTEVEPALAAPFDSVVLTPIGDCVNYDRYPSNDIDPDMWRRVEGNVDEGPCATICHQDVRCGSAVHTSSNDCYIKDNSVNENGSNLVPADSSLTVVQCSDPRCIGDNCDTNFDQPFSSCSGDLFLSRTTGFDLTPGEDVGSFEGVYFEEDCWELCHALEQSTDDFSMKCRTAVHLSDVKQCYLKSSILLASRLVGNGEDDFPRLVLLNCFGLDR